jgi:hypothetical protein
MKIIITVEVPDGAAVAVGTDESAAPVKSKGKTKAATESAPPAAPATSTAATAPAAVSPVPAAEAPTFPPLKAVNDVVSKLAGLAREEAVKILLKHGAAAVKTSTSQLKPEVYQAVIDDTEEAIDKINAAATQVANTGSLV